MVSEGQISDQSSVLIFWLHVRDSVRFVNYSKSKPIPYASQARMRELGCPRKLKSSMGNQSLWETLIIWPAFDQVR